MKSFFAQIVIVAALIVVGVTFPAVVYSTTCYINPCTSSTSSPCTLAGKGTNKARCGGSCVGTYPCACTRKDAGKNSDRCVCER
jgi:hypothetical protein